MNETADATPQPEQLWDIDDVARFLKLRGPDTIRTWRKKGYGPPACKMGKHLRWEPDVVRKWVQNGAA